MKRCLYIEAMVDTHAGRVYAEGIRRAFLSLTSQGLDVSCIYERFLGGRLYDPSQWVAVVKELNIKAVILSGSAMNTTDQADERVQRYMQGLLELLSYASERELPIFGICFGHQALACATGGRTKRFEYRAGMVKVDRLPQMPITYDWLAESYVMPVTHGDHVVELGADFLPLLTSDYCRYQAVAHKYLPWMSVQFHPEMTEGIKELPEDKDDFSNVSVAELREHDGQVFLLDVFRNILFRN